MLVAELLRVLDRLAPFAFAQAGDNCGLLVGNEEVSALRVVAALELTEPVLREAVEGGYDTVLTHHPLLYAPVRSLLESRPRERLLRGLVRGNLSLIACHTNLDAAPGGLADIAAQALGLASIVPLEPVAAGWYKLTGFIPETALEEVAAAVFAAGAGVIGEYRDCAFTAKGTGWFTPGPAARPALGLAGQSERTPEIRWETVVPRTRLGAVVRAFVAAHPYEEPAFDIYPVEDILPRAGLGRVGALATPVAVADLARHAADLFELEGVSWSGDGSRLVQSVGVVPGSGRTLLETAIGRCDVLVTGDLGYHEAEKAADADLSLIFLPHGDFEWWAFRRWSATVAAALAGEGVDVDVSREYGSPWHQVSVGCLVDHVDSRMSGTKPGQGQTPATVHIWIDGGSRGNPGPSAIGVLIEDDQGTVLQTISRFIGDTTNNVAEYQSLLAGLQAASALGATDVEVVSDSELLVKQMRGEYKVKNERLKPLHAEARQRAAEFFRFSIRHVERKQNVLADRLVNRALDEREGPGL